MQRNHHHRVEGASTVAVVGLATLFAAALAGCGGTTTNSPNIVPLTPSSSVAYGLNATYYSAGAGTFEVSGLESSDETKLYLTRATASTAVPLPSITDSTTGTIPLGFAPGGVFQNSAVGQAVQPGASVKFRVTLSNGNAANGNLYQITGATLTSPEVGTFSQPFTFNPNTTSGYGLANATYATGAFTLPFTTTGLHTFVVSVTDSKPETVTTTYQVVVVTPGASAVLVNSTAGASVKITNPTAGTTNPATTDEQGEAVLFSAPGSETITGPTTTENETLIAGQLTIADKSAL